MRKSRDNRIRAGLLCVLAVGVPTFADTVTLVTGKTLIGRINFDVHSALSIMPKNQSPLHVQWRDVIDLQIDSAPAAPPPPRVVVLIDGTRIVAIDVLSFDEREVRLKRPGGSVLALKTASVSSIDFAPALPHAAPAPGFAGAQLGEKDFNEGDILAISPASVKISSVLFGVQDFDTAKAVRAVYLRPGGAAKSAYVVHSRDGSTWQASAITIDAGKLAITTDLAGPTSLAADEITSIQLGPASADDLAGPGTPAGQPLLLAPGQQQNIDVAGKYRAVVLTFGISSTFMPTRAARLIVLADGKDVAHSAMLTSIDVPVTFIRSLEGVKLLTLKLEATGNAALGIAGEISEGRLLHLAP